MSGKTSRRQERQVRARDEMHLFSVREVKAGKYPDDTPTVHVRIEALPDKLSQYEAAQLDAVIKAHVKNLRESRRVCEKMGIVPRV